MSSDVIKSEILLFQTDTTVGLASQDAYKLSQIKERPSSKPFLKIFNSFEALTLRIPSRFKNRVRRSKKTTFIVKNQAFRVATPAVNSSYLQQFSWFYSTSANRSGAVFEKTFCENVADIIVEDKNALFETTPSRLIKLSHSHKRVLR